MSTPPFTLKTNFLPSFPTFPSLSTTTNTQICPTSSGSQKIYCKKEKSMKKKGMKGFFKFLLCTETRDSSTTLKLHYERTHLAICKKKFCCERCGSFFMTNEEKKEHLRSKADLKIRCSRYGHQMNKSLKEARKEAIKGQKKAWTRKEKEEDAADDDVEGQKKTWTRKEEEDDAADDDAEESR